MYQFTTNIILHVCHFIDRLQTYFQSLLTDEQVANAPVLILGNKIDKPGAASEDEIRHHFGLHGQTTGKVIMPCRIFIVLEVESWIKSVQPWKTSQSLTETSLTHTK